MSTEEQYAASILGALHDLFDDESEHYIGELSEVDGTQLFTALLNASGLFYNELTGHDDNSLEFTHTLNTLAFMQAVKFAKKDAKGED